MRKYRAFFILCVLLGSMTIIYVLWQEISMELSALMTSSQLFCYWSRSNGIMELGQGEWDEAMLVPSRCIFFHEITCSRLNFTPRQACAVESAARHNRMLNIFLFFFATGRFSGRSQKLVDILETYNNVYIRRIRLSKYVIDTPMENWLSKDVKKFSVNQKWSREDLSDYIKMLTLWKFGGVALNLDSVIQTSLNELTTFAGVRNDQDKNVGVFGFDISTDFGRKFINVCIEIIKSTNMNNYLKYNITKVITEAIEKLCYQPNVFNQDCKQFTIYPPSKFYPISLQSWKDYFDESKAEETIRTIRHAAAIHLWNDYSKNTKANNLAAYVIMAKKNCPKIYMHFKDEF